MTEGSVCRIGLEVSGEQDVLCSPAPLCRISAYMSPGLKDNIPSVTEPPTTTHTHTHTYRLTITLRPMLAITQWELLQKHPMAGYK